MRSDYLRTQQPSPQSGKAPRGLGCKTIVVTVIVVLGIAATVAILRYALGAFWPSNKARQAADFEAAVGQQLTQEQAQLEADQDGDGLTDLLENIYRSDPATPDTDGDGTNDGDEVAEGRDPITKGPNDAFDLEAAEGLLAEESYSTKYIATLPTDVSREALLDQDRVAAFVEEVRGELVREVPDSEITITAASSAAAIEAYLDTVSANTNDAVETVTNEDIDEAFRLNYQLGQPEAIDVVIEKLAGNVAVLEDVSVPTPAVPLHKQLLGASRALLENVQLLKRMPDDLIGGLVAAKNIEDLGAEFTEIAEMVAALEQQYGLE